MPILDLSRSSNDDQSEWNNTMRCLTLALIATAGVLSTVSPAEARTTRTFNGSNPAEVEKNARQAGYSYPDGDMNCSSRCSQRWAKD